VSHTDPVILALLALGETGGTAGDAGHAETCARCRAELARLTEVVELARNDSLGERLEMPPPHVWDRIIAAVGPGQAVGDHARDGAVPHAEGAGAGNGAAAPAGTGAAAPGREPRARRGILARRRGRLATGLAGLAAGLIIGIGSTAGIAQLTKAPATRVVAQIQLSPLPEFPQWHDACEKPSHRKSAGRNPLDTGPLLQG
jgi:hypothetical protein